MSTSASRLLASTPAGAGAACAPRIILVWATVYGRAGRAGTHPTKAIWDGEHILHHIQLKLVQVVVSCLLHIELPPVDALRCSGSETASQGSFRAEHGICLITSRSISNSGCSESVASIASALSHTSVARGGAPMNEARALGAEAALLRTVA